jgi:hypothetical protein
VPRTGVEWTLRSKQQTDLPGSMLRETQVTSSLQQQPRFTILLLRRVKTMAAVFKNSEKTGAGRFLFFHWISDEQYLFLLRINSTFLVQELLVYFEKKFN